MGLQEGRRAQLRSAELSELEKQRQEERVLERQTVLRASYGRARWVLFAVAACTLITILVLPRRYKISFPLSLQSAQMALAWGYQGNTAGWAVAVGAGLLFLALWWLSRRHQGWMIAAAAMLVPDGIVSFFMLNMMNYEQSLVNGSAGLDVAAGVPGMGGSAYDYMSAFFITVFLHVVVIAYLVHGAVQGARLRRLPEVSIEEKTVEKAVYYDGQDYTEHPEEGTEPLRDAEKGAAVLARAEAGGHVITVERAWGVTYLAIDGRIYNDQKGQVEPLYHLRACVDGIHIDAENRPATGYSMLTLFVDGEAVAQKRRLW